MAETGDTGRDLSTLFEASIRAEGVFRRLYGDPTLPLAGGDIPRLVAGVESLNKRLLEHAGSIRDNREALKDLRSTDRRRWKTAKWLVGLALTAGGGSAAWVAFREWVSGR